MTTERRARGLVILRRSRPSLLTVTGLAAFLCVALLATPRVGELHPPLLRHTPATTSEIPPASSAEASATGSLAQLSAMYFTSGTAKSRLARLETKGRAPKTGYSREKFGQAWRDLDRNGCDQRNDVLRRDLRNVKIKPGTYGCVVLRGTLTSLYSGRKVKFVRGPSSYLVPIDHVVALSDAWQKGARRWSTAKRERFANDFLELRATDLFSNSSKGDSDAASWLPPRKSHRCRYVARQIAIKYTYGLWVTRAERDAMARVLIRCPARNLPRSQPVPLG